MSGIKPDILLREHQLLTFVSLVWPQGWFSPGQIFVLDEYCARYGVRGCYRHLCYLADLLARAERGLMIDPTLIHYSFAFCASHVHGNRYVVLSLFALVFYFACCAFGVLFLSVPGPALSSLRQHGAGSNWRIRPFWIDRLIESFSGGGNRYLWARKLSLFCQLLTAHKSRQTAKKKNERRSSPM